MQCKYYHTGANIHQIEERSIFCLIKTNLHHFEINKQHLLKKEICIIGVSNELSMQED